MITLPLFLEGIMLQALMYGAGNIGRGFIGPLMAQSGYKVVFVDINRPLVDALNLPLYFCHTFAIHSRIEPIIPVKSTRNQLSNLLQEIMHPPLGDVKLLLGQFQA